MMAIPLFLAEFIEPNWHVALVHFPIALLVLGVVLEIVSWVAPTLKPAARWMMLLGALAGPAVAFSGVYALNEIAREMSSAPHGAWYQVTAGSRLSADQWAYLTRHAYLQLGATVAALLVVCVYLGASDGARRALYWPGMLLMLGVAGASGLGAHIGGQTVYVHGTGVLPVMGSAGEAPATMPSGVKELIPYFAPPIELHAALAGVVVALGCAALACAYRNSVTVREPPPERKKAVNPGTGRFEPPPPLPPVLLAASRLMLLVALVGGLTALAGWWKLSRDSEETNPRALYEIVVPFPPGDALKAEHRDELRRPAHVVTGTLLVAIPLLLAGWVRWRPQGRVVLTLATLAFVSASAAQSGLGSLLLFDDVTGPLTKLSGPAVEATSESVEPATMPAALSATQPAEEK